MAELALIVIAAALVNNLVLVQSLGVYPLFGASGRVETAIGTALVTGLVLTIAATLTIGIPSFVLALAPFFLRDVEKLTTRVVMGTLLIVFGVYLITALSGR